MTEYEPFLSTAGVFSEATLESRMPDTIMEKPAVYTLIKPSQQDRDNLGFEIPPKARVMSNRYKKVSYKPRYHVT